MTIAPTRTEAAQAELLAVLMEGLDQLIAQLQPLPLRIAGRSRLAPGGRGLMR